MNSFKRTLGSRWVGLTLGLLLAASITNSASALTGTYVVHGPDGGGNTYPNPPFPGCNNPLSNGGWLTVDTPGYPSPLLTTFVSGPASPPLGAGSVQEASAGAGAAKALLFTTFGGTPLAGLAFILSPASTQFGSYAGSVTGAENVFILFVSYDGGATVSDQLQFVPALNGCFVPGAWATCNFLAGQFTNANPAHDPTGTGGAFSIADYVGFAANAAAAVPSKDASNPTLGVVSSSSGPAFSANMDAFQLATVGVAFTGTPFNTLVWDFEADCTNYGGDADQDCYCDVPNPLVVNHDTCPGVSNFLCTDAGVPTACCTGAGTGTCDDQTDTDGDGSGDVCDNCPALGNATCTSFAAPNLCCTGSGTGTCGSQTDVDANGIGDVCQALCPSAPATCEAAGKNSIALRDNSLDTTKRKFQYRWSTGTLAAAQADFGDPVAGTSNYSLCVYDETGGTPTLKMSLGIAPGGTCNGMPCWSATSKNNGWVYKSKAGNGNGITKVRLLAGAAGKPAIQVNGKGANLPFSTPISGTEFFDQDTQVTVQLHNGVAGNCWGSSFTTAKKNIVSKFNAVAP